MLPHVRVPEGVDARGRLSEEAKRPISIPWIAVDRLVGALTAFGIVWSLWRIGDALAALAGVAANK